jgi:hypothetical protein
VAIAEALTKPEAAVLPIERGRLEHHRRQLAFDVAAGSPPAGSASGRSSQPSAASPKRRLGSRMAAQRGKVLMRPKRSTTSATSPRVGARRSRRRRR